MNTTTSYLQPALYGALVLAVLSALPIVYLGNGCCCLWVVGGGLVAAYVFQENHVAPMTPADGAVVGLLAGVLGACLHLLVSIPIDIVMAPLERGLLQRILDMAGTMPPDMRDLLERVSAQSAGIGIGLILVRRAIVFIPMLIIGSIFATLGGVLGSAIFAKKLPPGPIDVPSAT